MSTIILSINAGSSSLKTALYTHDSNKQLKSLAKAEISNINQRPAQLKYTTGSGKHNKSALEDVSSHDKAFEHILKLYLEDDSLTEVESKDAITQIVHRVVHGGNDFYQNTVITKETFHKLEALEDLAPLHNASAVGLIKACHERLPKVKNVACFDSAFHHSMPEHVKAYMIDQKVAKEKGLRKYGFHGLSYAYITRSTASYLQKPKEDLNLIALHLGSGASMCAIKDGKSIDTTMGLTPVSGLPGGSRSGDIDPALIFHYTSEASKMSPSSTKELHISTAEEILNKKCGWKALTGTSDFAEIAKADAPDTHKLALDVFVDRIIGYVGSYYVKLGGRVDAIVFAGGIGEKSALLRKVIIDRVACLGFKIDESKNEKPDEENIVDIGPSGDEKRTLICLTDEDFEMAYSAVEDAQ